MCDILAFQPTFRPPLPEIYGCANYREQRELLIRIDELIELTDADSKFQKLCIERYDEWQKASSDSQEDTTSNWQPPYNPYTPTGKVKQSWLAHTKTAFRSNILRNLTNRSLRGMSFHMSDSELTKWFCYINEYGTVKPPSKSTIDRYEDWIDSDSLRQLINDIITQAAGIDESDSQDNNNTTPLNLKEPIDLSEAWWDGCCLKANIHWPADWILLRDICRTLMLAVILIRERGLKNRMPQEPSDFIRDINKLVIEMTQCKRKKGAKKERKRILRQMVKLEKKIAKHAQKHRDILLARRAETDLSQAQAQQIVDRINGVLDQLPEAIEQARERIIREKLVDNEDKILSIYEKDINVIIRGKADARVEFGNCLRLAEQFAGVIIDFQLYKDSIADNSAEPFREGVERMIDVTHGNLSAVWTDRGMDSKENVAFLESKEITNGICPKDPKLLEKKMSDPDYAAGQKRRASTEARIGIFQNKILGGKLRTKGFENRERSVAWAVLSHNFWVLARLPQKEKKQPAELPEAAAA